MDPEVLFPSRRAVLGAAGIGAMGMAPASGAAQVTAPTDKPAEMLSVNVKDHYAVGDGQSHPLSTVFVGKTLEEVRATFPGIEIDNLDFVEVDWAATQFCVSRGGSVFMPAGRYVMSGELRMPSGTTLEGAGIDSTILTLKRGVDYLCNNITNAGNDRSERTLAEADKNIRIAGMTLDGSGATPRANLESSSLFGVNANGERDTALHGSRCCLAFSTVTDSVVQRVKAVRYLLHGFAIDASQYANDRIFADGSDSQELYVQPGPSQDVVVRDCVADPIIMGNDDPFTTHWSDRVTFEACRAVNTQGGWKLELKRLRGGRGVSQHDSPRLLCERFCGGCAGQGALHIPTGHRFCNIQLHLCGLLDRDND